MDKLLWIALMGAALTACTKDVDPCEEDPASCETETPEETGLEVWGIESSTVAVATGAAVGARYVGTHTMYDEVLEPADDSTNAVGYRLCEVDYGVVDIDHTFASACPSCTFSFKLDYDAPASGDVRQDEETWCDAIYDETDFLTDASSWEDLGIGFDGTDLQIYYPDDPNTAENDAGWEIPPYGSATFDAGSGAFTFDFPYTVYYY